MNRLPCIVSCGCLMWMLVGCSGFQVSEPSAGSVMNEGYGDYVYVPAGAFNMGDNFQEGGPDELPVHEVMLDAYYIGKYEVSNEEYAKFIEDDGYANPAYWSADYYGDYGSQSRYWNKPEYQGGAIAGNEQYPVVGVAWYEAQAYCSWLTKKTGTLHRLPTEAEWEKAARGTDQRRYAWGNEFSANYANYWDSGDPWADGAAPVGIYDGDTHNGYATGDNASPYGVRDMPGNVREWCSDWYDEQYYEKTPVLNPGGADIGDHRVIRGGGWDGDIFGLRATGRMYYDPETRYFAYPTGRYFDIGFRCVRVP